MDASVTLALIALATVIVTGMITPIAIAVVQYKIRAAEKIVEKSQSDAIAEKVEQAADGQALIAQDFSGKLQEIKSQTDTIHSMVNSRLTAIMQSLYDALVGQVEALSANALISKETGVPNNKDADDKIEKLRRRIVDLKSALNVRDDNSHTKE